MLGWVIACHDYHGQELVDKLEKQAGPLAQCRVVNYWRGLSVNMLSRMMCDALHETDTGKGVIFLTDGQGTAPYRAAAMLSHKHEHCEVIAGISLSILQQMLPLRESFCSSDFREAIVKAGEFSGVTSLWHQQQKNPPFVLLHHG